MYLPKSNNDWNATPWIKITWLSKDPGPCFNLKMSSYQYRESHCGDKTVVRSSYLHNGISYSGKRSSLYWIGAQGIINSNVYEIHNCQDWHRTTNIYVKFMHSYRYCSWYNCKPRPCFGPDTGELAGYAHGRIVHWPIWVDAHCINLPVNAWYW